MTFPDLTSRSSAIGIIFGLTVAALVACFCYMHTGNVEGIRFSQGFFGGSLSNLMLALKMGTSDKGTA